MKKILLSLLCMLPLAACGGTPSEVALLLTNGSGETVNLLVEIAQTPEDRTRGLMGRESIDENKGMLFIFPEEEMLSFWMKDTLVPLDIMFFNAEGKFVNAFTMEPCTEDPCPSYRSAELAQFALEAGTGFREKNGIGVGWTLDMRQVGKFANPE